VVKGNTHKITLELYNEGLNVEEIAQKRGLSGTTIYSHLAKLYADGEKIDLNKFVSKADLSAVKKAKTELEYPEALKPYYEHFEEAIDYWTIKLALTILEKEE
jgi:ATP-dependent DNA helicase RecQ